MNAQHIGSSLDDFLAEEDLLEDATVIAVKRKIVLQKKGKWNYRALQKQIWPKE